MEDKEIIEVYHFDMERAAHNEKILYFIRPKAEDVLNLVKQGIYTKVAEVASNDLEEAFELTNHIDSSWQENKGVKAFTDRARSTSVGDLCVRGDEVFVVSAIGFEKLSEEINNLLKNPVKQDKKHKIK